MRCSDVPQSSATGHTNIPCHGTSSHSTYKLVYHRIFCLGCTAEYQNILILYSGIQQCSSGRPAWADLNIWWYTINNLHISLRGLVHIIMSTYFSGFGPLPSLSAFFNALWYKIYTTFLTIVQFQLIPLPPQCGFICKRPLGTYLTAIKGNVHVEFADDEIVGVWRDAQN